MSTAQFKLILLAILMVFTAHAKADGIVPNNGRRKVSFSPVWKSPYNRPGDLTTEMIDFTQTEIASASFESDRECGHSPAAIAQTELSPEKIDPTICDGRDREIVWTASNQGLFLCEKGSVAKAFRTSIGSNGTGKLAEGDRKTPVGSYWLGPPKRSTSLGNFGVFIPVGYPNAEDLKQRKTGNSVGIHGPKRVPLFKSACSGIADLEENWTAGCIALGRDEQIKLVAEWVVTNWPVQLHILEDR